MGWPIAHGFCKLCILPIPSHVQSSDPARKALRNEDVGLSFELFNVSPPKKLPVRQRDRRAVAERQTKAPQIADAWKIALASEQPKVQATENDDCGSQFFRKFLEKPAHRF